MAKLTFPGFDCRFGLEGLTTFKRDNRYDPETYEIAVPKDPSVPDGEEIKIGVFDKVTVEITVEKVGDALLYSIMTTS